MMDPHRAEDAAALSLTERFLAADRVRAEVRTDGQPDRQARHRDEWPELWAAVDGLGDVLDRIDPPPTPQTSGLFDGSFTRLPPPT